MTTPNPLATPARRRSARLAALTRRRNAERALLGSTSRRTLAVKIGADQSHVARILKGERGIRFDIAVKMATALGHTTDRFHTLLTSLLRTYPRRQVKREGEFSAHKREKKATAP